MKNILLLFLVFIFVSTSYGQNVLKFSDGKFITGENTPATIIKNKSVLQFTDDNYQDLEVFSAVNPKNPDNIITSFMWADPSGQSAQPIKFKTFYTLDGGENWEAVPYPEFYPHGLSANRKITGGGDPVIVFDNNGTAHFSWIYALALVYSMDSIFIEFVMHYAYSEDGGATWIRPDNDTIAWGVFDYDLSVGITGIDTMYPPDKEWATYDISSGNLIVSLTEFWNLDSLENLWGVRIKPDTSDTFSEKIYVTPDSFLVCTHGSLASDNLGHVYAFYPFYPDTANPVERLACQISQDGGNSWSDPIFITDVNVENFTAAGQTNNTNTKAYNRLTTNLYAAVDTSDGQYSGRIYVVWNGNDTNYFSKVDVYFSYSDDFGHTWTTPKIINSDSPRDYGFHHRPTITVSPQGKVIIAWYDNRNAVIPNIYDTDYFIAVSEDGGQTFTEKKVTPFPFDYNKISSSFYVGEYNQIAASDDYIYVFWGALDSTQHDVEIYYSKLSYDLSGIEQTKPITDKISIDMFPNPADDFIQIKVSSKENETFKLMILSLDGKILSNCELNTNKKIHTIPIKNLQPGVYMAVAKTKHGNFIFKFIKN